jgi:hypothetical protein
LSIVNTIAWLNIGGVDSRLFPQLAIYTNSDEFQFVSGEGNLKENPMFVDSNRGNFVLELNSPCKNAGNPDDIYNDTNSSRNDMGIYGGPYGDDW